MTFTEAKERAGQYAYGLLYKTDGITIDEASKVATELDEESCMEARFFDDNEELHIYIRDGILQGSIISDATVGIDESISKDYKLDDKYKKIGSKLKIVQYLATDEDGQKYIKFTRLSGIE